MGIISAHPKIGQMNQPLKSLLLLAMKAGWKANLGPEVCVWWGGSHLVFLSVISCLSRHLNELTGPKFLSQRVQILGQDERFLFAVLDVCPSVPLQGKNPRKVPELCVWVFPLSAAKPEGHLSWLCGGRFSEGPDPSRDRVFDLFMPKASSFQDLNLLIQSEETPKAL